MSRPLRKDELRQQLQVLTASLRPSHCILVFLSSCVLAFGLYHVHSLSGVTEGGLLGLTLLLDYWLHISPAVTSFVGSILCYALGWKLFGKEFLMYSFIATVGFSVSYKIFEQFDPLWPQLADMPLAAAIVGALFVGISTGICVRIGGATCGDDALAMSVSHITHINIQWVYLFFDLVILILSLSYIPLQRIFYSLLTVILSGQIIGLMQKIPLPLKAAQQEDVQKEQDDPQEEV